MNPFSVSLVAIILLIFPSLLFSYVEEKWGILDAFYYCFISLTTIGLGDFVPGNASNQPFYEAYMICSTIYLILILIGTILILKIFYGIPELNVGHFFNVAHGREENEYTPILRPYLFNSSSYSTI